MNRRGESKGGGQRDRRIRSMPAGLVFCTLFLRYFLSPLDSLFLPRYFFRSVIPSGLPVPVRSSDVNGLPQDRPLRLGRMDGQPEEVTVLTESVFDICPSFYPGFIGAADVNFVC